jgi:hypothetical protein
MPVPTSEEFVRRWAAENGFAVTSGWSNEIGPPAFALIADEKHTCIYRGETLELAFSRMESVLNGQDPFE